MKLRLLHGTLTDAAGSPVCMAPVTLPAFSQSNLVLLQPGALHRRAAVHDSSHWAHGQPTNKRVPLPLYSTNDWFERLLDAHYATVAHSAPLHPSHWLSASPRHNALAGSRTTKLDGSRTHTRAHSPAKLHKPFHSQILVSFMVFAQLLFSPLASSTMKISRSIKLPIISIHQNHYHHQ